MTRVASDGHRGSTAILAEIDETRERMDLATEELIDRLRPRHLLDELLHYIRRRSESSHVAKSSRTDGGVSEVGLKAWGVVREHPLPAVIIAAGFVLLAVQKSVERGRRFPHGAYSGSYVDARTGEPYGGSAVAGAGAGAGAGAIFNPGSRREQSMKDKGRDFGAESGRDFGERLRETMSPGLDLGEETPGIGERMREHASDLGEKVQHGYEQTKDAIGRFVHERPLAVAAGAIAAGLIIGLLIPRSRHEVRYLGSLGQRVKDRGRDIGGEVVERSGRVAQKTMDAFAKEAERQGLTPEALLEQMRSGSSTSGGPKGESSLAGTETGRSPMSHSADDIGEER